MTTVYLIRHAEAEGNLYRRIQGQYDVNVTPNGHRQIAALEQRFRNISVDACWSSDLIRTRTTAQAVCRPHNIPLQLDDGLLEVGLGRWENVPFGKLYACEPELMDIFDHDPVNWQVEGCETYIEYTSRFLNALNRITDLHRNATVCLFSHGAVIRAAMKCLFPDAKIGHSDNTAVTLLTRDDDGYHPVYFNDTSHLTEEISTLARQNWWRNDGSRDYNLWFRDDVTVPESISVPTAAQAHVAFLDHEPVGAVFLRDNGNAGQIVHMEILPQWQGLDLEEQLLGQAVFTFRDQGKTSLYVHAAPSVDAFCAAQGLCRDGEVWSMDIRLKKV
jgi:broad specificity phosphatase PhoE